MWSITTSKDWNHYLFEHNSNIFFIEHEQISFVVVYTALYKLSDLHYITLHLAESNISLRPSGREWSVTIYYAHRVADGVGLPYWSEQLHRKEWNQITVILQTYAKSTVYIHPYRLCCIFWITSDFWSLLWNIHWQTGRVYSYSQLNVVPSICQSEFHPKNLRQFHDWTKI